MRQSAPLKHFVYLTPLMKMQVNEFYIFFKKSIENHILFQFFIMVRLIVLIVLFTWKIIFKGIKNGKIRCNILLQCIFYFIRFRTLIF